jgi:hypothetical protein
MPFQSSMGAHKLEVRQGDRNSIINHTGVLAAATAAGAIAGRVVSLTAGNQLEPGLAVGRLPFFAWSGTDENNAPDVTRTKGMPYAGQARFGTISGFAAAELSSTEFVADAGLTPGAALTAIGITGALADRGKLKLAGATDVVVGFVAPAGQYTSPDGFATLAFYADYVRGTTVPNA